MDAKFYDKDYLMEAVGFENEELWEWLNKLEVGVGTYEDVDNIAELIGDNIAATLADDYSDEALDILTEVGYEVVSDAGVIAQNNLNRAAGIGIKPMTKKYPQGAVSAIKEDIAKLAPEAVATALKDKLPTMFMRFVDEVVKYNADFQADAGLEPIIVRTWSGSYPSHDTKHTDWCHDLAGTYVLGTARDAPANVYVRHEGCRCKVEYFPNAQAKGQITALAKNELDYYGELWNTKPETLEKRAAALERRLKREAEKKAKK